uniref:Uncharacterized protein n=1 Tax=Plectus sambesii TaxID=2011161 RepID=A0A914V727_9BILA
MSLSELPFSTADSPSWRRAREKRVNRQTTPNCTPSVNSKMKVRDRRKLREKRRSPGAPFLPSTEETTSGDEDEKDFNSGTLTKETWQAPWAEGGARQNSVERTPSSGGHQPIGKRLSPAVANFMCRFRGSKSQSDLDADCEDNTADYDSASMMSASEALAPNSSQFFVPAASGEGDFR